MNRRMVVVGVIILFLLVGVNVSGDIETKESTTSFDDNILYVGGSGPGNYTTIQGAIDDALDGDTVFVYDDSSPYYENIVINNSINLVGEDRETTIIYGNTTNGTMIYIISDNSTITGFTIQNGYVGILVNSNEITITDNIINNNRLNGIEIVGDSSKITISNNIISNSGRGIWAMNNLVGEITISDNNIYGMNDWADRGISVMGNNILIFGNKINNSYTGIWTETKKINIIYNNIMDNRFGIEVYGSLTIIACNNFIKIEDVVGVFNTKLIAHMTNKWFRNYYDNKIFGPKFILGYIEIVENTGYGGIGFPWFNIDWFPKKIPYDIEVL